MAPSLAMRLALLVLALVAAAAEQLSAGHDALSPVSFKVDEENFNGSPNSGLQFATEGGYFNYRFSDSTGVATDHSAPAPSPTEGEVAAAPSPARYHARPPSSDGRHRSGAVQPPSPPAPWSGDDTSTDLIPSAYGPDQMALAPGPELDGLNVGAASGGVVSAGVVAAALLGVICLGHL